MGMIIFCEFHVTIKNNYKHMKKVVVLLSLVATGLFAQAQTVEEILNSYFENVGGKEKLSTLNATQMTAKVNVQGMELPVEIVNTKDGKSLMKFQFQGKELVQQAFDGETAWAHNMMTMVAEKSDAETTENMKREAGSFPDPFLNYEEKGYKVELIGKEDMEGTPCFKVKLTKKPLMVDGQEQENVVYYFFDAENYVPLAAESMIPSGPMKGKISQQIFSDYQEVDGLYFPFSLTFQMKGEAGGQSLKIDSVMINPEIDDSIFAFKE